MEPDYTEPLSIVAKKLEHEIVVKSHLLKEKKDECGYCGQAFGPDEIVIEKNIFGVVWHFCSEDCYRDFLDASNFKDKEFAEEDKHDQGTVYQEDEEE